MKRRRKTLAALLSAMVLVATLGGCSRTRSDEGTATPAVPAYAQELRDKVTTDAMVAHLQKLQEIADANGGTRAVGTPGYEASVDYVAKMLRDKGFDVETPEFGVRLFDADEPELTVSGTNITAHPLEFTIGTVPQGVSGPLVAAKAEETPGCTASDYDGLPVSGAVVLVDRGSCPFSTKLAAATERGAAAMIVADSVVEEQMGGTLGEETDVKIPVISVSKEDGARLRAQPGPTTIKLNVNTKTLTSRNVIAQTKTGSTQNVVMVGAHLDSVPEGPGINDNGSGVAAVLETAVQMGSSPPVQNAVRFGFWGAEEAGLVGSEEYIESLDPDALKDIALYLNFDMEGSPNPGYFTYDGDQSTPPDPERGAPRVPEGSAGIERTLVSYLKSAGKPPQDTSFVGNSDYDSFTRAGIPAGGLFAGASAEKTAEQAELWGGQAGQPFDPNYHQDADTLDNIDRTALGINGAGAAYVVAVYSQDVSGRNGVPIREDRTRHALRDS